MRIAFTAPMKPLDDPVPSGDRTMGRLIVRALETAGHEVSVASRFRAWRKDGGIDMQVALEAEARREAGRIESQWRAAGTRPDAFLTYHLYHKAPDWIGPALADAFDIPYAVIEASRAPKRRTGAWAHGFAAADAALARADRVAALHSADLECLTSVVPAERLTVCAPFLDEAPFRHAAEAKTCLSSPIRLLAVAMMRPGDKRASYKLLADALALLPDRPWQLTIAGDGPCQAEIAQWFDPARVTFTGAVTEDDMPALYAGHDALVWPAIREAFGFVFLEAQASGLAVVGGDTFGVPEVVADGTSGLLSPEGDVAAFAKNLARLMDDPGLVAHLARGATANINGRHSLASGAARLDALMRCAQATHAAGYTGDRP
ncbi:glycosyltransferase family 4 protein [Stappia sp. ES.058]|uniref:glycosyltransferase family 4 protein n=1 Tax=Stappia sp. ES.058 TaxID=1881061 RepID=UPI00087BCBE1|nr:glycosyltransferase family 4 protein [Stappia sp. ES.058]SDT99575.1 Glycosyltransferase involved in cell wall bisynthesis [Stappia sp. ES.058]